MLKDFELGQRIAQAALNAAQINKAGTLKEVIAAVYNLVTDCKKCAISDSNDNLAKVPDLREKKTFL